MTENQTLEELYAPLPPSFVNRHDKNGYYITSRDLAELLKLNNHSVRSIINKNFNDLTSLSPVNAIRFNLKQFLHGGRPEQVYYLNEFQATLLVLLARPSKASNKAKQQVVETMKLNNNRYKQYRELTELLLKRATGGLTAQQIKKQRHVKVALDGLTVKEQERYKQLENIAIGLVGLNKTWNEIKGILLLA